MNPRIAAPGFSAQVALSNVQETNSSRTNMKAGWLKIRSQCSRSPAVTIASQDSISISPKTLGADSVP